jgi:hypothetical protein
VRNHKYIITIKDVLGPGYANIEEASASRGGINNLDYEVQVVNGDDERGMVLYDGRNRLEIDNISEIVLDKGAGPANGVKFNLRYVYDDYSGDKPEFGTWTAELSYTTWGGMNATNATSLSVMPPRMQGQANVSSEINVYPAVNSGSGSDQTATLTIKAGRLTHTIKVTLRANRVGSIRVDTSQPLHLSKKDILFYSWDGREILGDADAQIYAGWNGGVGTCSVKSGSISNLNSQPFAYATTGGMVEIPTTTAGLTLASSPQVLTVGPKLLPANAEIGLLASQLTFTTPAPRALDNTEARLFLKNFFVRRINKEFVVFDNSQNQSIALDHNVDFTIEPYNYPAELLALGELPGGGGKTTAADDHDHDMILNSNGVMGDLYSFKLPTLTVEDFERLGLPNPLTLQFKVKATPRYIADNFPEYLPEAGLEKIITVMAVPYAGDAKTVI